jgi:Mononegavirales RNA dependent RNA polymerase
LRQKGWTLISMLVIEREGRTRNTQLIVLAQGDNQAITTFYRKGNYSQPSDIRQDAVNAYKNNQALMETIRASIDKLGFVINENETVVSSEYLNYGKLFTLWGNRIPVETKRYARATGCTNDPSCWIVM